MSTNGASRKWTMTCALGVCTESLGYIEACMNTSLRHLWPLYSYSMIRPVALLESFSTRLRRKSGYRCPKKENNYSSASSVFPPALPPCLGFRHQTSQERANEAKRLEPRKASRAQKPTGYNNLSSISFRGTMVPIIE